MDSQTLDAAWRGADDPARPIAFLVSAPVRPGDLPSRLGHADYSYGFVLQALGPVLERIGSWRLVPRPESSLPAVAARAAAEGFRPVHLSLSPPQGAYLTPALPNILYPFWEFPRIPDRDFGLDTRQNWARITGKADLILTACTLTADAFRRAGVNVPVGIVPVPVPPESFAVPDWDPGHSWTLECRHVAWGGEPRDEDPDSRDHGAATSAEPPPKPPGFLTRAERRLRQGYHRHVRRWLSDEAAQRIQRVKNRLLLRPPGGYPPPPPPRVAPGRLTLSGLVYTSIFNLCDPRKNPRDLLSAFLVAFRDRPDVTLVLKLAANPSSEREVLDGVGWLYRGLGIEHRCRVVVVTDYLTEDELDELYRATTFYVNTSHAEGACLPLQRALASGRPGIAPAHTSMSDYLDDSVALVVESHEEPAPWPHDPEQRCETTRQRLVWSSLRDQFQRSAELAEAGDRSAYQALAASGRARMRQLASQDAAAQALRRALRLLDVRRRPGATDWAA